MKSRKFGPTSFQVPVIGQGTWQIPESGKDKDEAVKSLQRGFELGMVHIDTAEMYGHAEEVIREAFKPVSRDKVFLVSKVLPTNASYLGTISALERTLKRLGTDYLDCYLLHWRGDRPLAETLGAFEKLEEEGKIRSFGVSNFDMEDLQEALDSLSKGKIACNQVMYNLKERGIERRLMQFCQEKNIAVVGYTPYGEIPDANSNEYRVLSEIAAKHQATIRQVILAFLTRLEGTFSIPKAAKPLHVEENAGADPEKLKLDQEDLKQIDSIYPVPQKDVPLAVL